MGAYWTVSCWKLFGISLDCAGVPDNVFTGCISLSWSNIFWSVMQCVGFIPSSLPASTHPLNVLVTVQSCVLCPAQASVSTTSCMTSSACVTQTRAWTSTSTASSAVWSGSKPCSVSQSHINTLKGSQCEITLCLWDCRMDLNAN